MGLDKLSGLYGVDICNLGGFFDERSCIDNK